MDIQTGWVTGIGYEGETVEGLIQSLVGLKISVVVDVRMNAISRKKGFSKTALSTALAASGIEYLHRPALGNPKTNRDGYAELHTPVGDACRSLFRESLNAPLAQGALDEIAALAGTRRVAIFCFERSELNCHRQQVIESVRSRVEKLVEA